MIKKTCSGYCFMMAICLSVIIFFFNGSSISSEKEKEKIAVSPQGSPFRDEYTVKNNIAKFDGELFKYNIGFWVFDKMGIATLQCRKMRDRVTVIIDAYTTGIFDKFLHRHNTYKSTMVFDYDTKKLKPLVFNEKRIKGEKEKTKITNYDYVNEVRKFKALKNGALRREKEFKLDKNVSDDAISAFYNLRNEIYGEVKEGTSFNIRTIYRDRTTDSQVSVRLPEKSDKLSRWKRSQLQASFAADITMDPEIFDSKEGKMVIFFTDDLRPVGFIAKDIVGFGDLYGVLDEDVN